jgi:hypothetical protein
MESNLKQKVLQKCQFENEKESLLHYVCTSRFYKEATNSFEPIVKPKTRLKEDDILI